jgi:hypothetical protein
MFPITNLNHPKIYASQDVHHIPSPTVLWVADSNQLISRTVIALQSYVIGV